MATKIQNENIKSAAELIADGGSASQLPNDTKVYLTANSLNKTLYQAIVDNDLSGGGGGGAGSGDTIVLINADDLADLSGWISGDGTITDGAALPGGSATDTFALETSSPFEGTQSFKSTSAAGSVGTYRLYPISIDPVWRGHTCTIKVPHIYNGAASDGYFIVWDATNLKKLVATQLPFESTSTSKNTACYFDIPSNCTQIYFGFQYAVENIGKILQFDMVHIVDGGALRTNVEDKQYLKLDTSPGFGSTATAIRRFSNTTESNGSGLFTYADDSTNGARFTFLRSCYVNLTWAAQASAGNPYWGFSKNASSTSTSINGLAATQKLSYARTNATDNLEVASWSGYVAAGDIIRPHAQVGASMLTATDNELFTIAATAQVESLITPASSSDSVIYTTNAGNAIVSGVVTVVDFEDKTKDSLGLVTTGASWKYTADSDGDRFIQSIIGYNAASFSAGGVVEIYIYKNGSSFSYRQDRIVATVTQTPSLSIAAIVPMVKGDYIDIRTAQYEGSNRTLQASGTRNQVSITNLNKNALVASPVDRICYISDIKPNNTHGGTFTSGSDQTRTINTLSGDTSFITLSGNQLTIQAGTYDVNIKCPAYIVRAHRAKLYNTTDALATILGTNELAYDGATDPASTSSHVIGRFTISSTKVFEVRHRCSVTGVTSGFGSAMNFGENEVYLNGWIKKVK